MLQVNTSAALAGVLTLGIEIVAGRMLAPFFGSSLHQWAALIGVVLLAYIVGYELHGALTRRGPALPLLLGGAYVLLLPAWIFDALDAALPLPLWAGALAGALLCAGVPSTLWASVLPRLQKSAGPKRAARVLAWSAAGNLAGAWGIAFVAIPGLGTRATLLALGLLSVALALYWALGARRLGAAAAGLACLAFGAAELLRAPSAPHGAQSVLRRDSAYQSIEVFDEGFGPRAHRALSLNGSVQFHFNPSERLTRGSPYEYYNFSTAAALWTGSGAPARSVLVLGLGGGLIPWQLRQFFPSMPVRAFELDAEVERAAREAGPLARAGRVDVTIGDGRQLLRAENRAGRERVEYVLADMFLNSYVPFHLTTREFFDEARERLVDDGVFVANLHTVFATSGLLPRLEATMRDVFGDVVALDLPAGTTLVLAARGGTPLVERLRRAAADVSAPAELRALSARARDGVREAATPAQVASLLTDDRNDTEQLLYETRRRILVSRPF